MRSHIYIEGAESKEDQVRCREGFRTLFEKAGLSGRLPRLSACGGRNSAFDDFTTAHAGKGTGDYGDAKNMTRQKFLARISSEIGKRGVVDVLRRGISDGPLHFEMFYGTPSPGNAKAAESFAQNRFRFIPRSRSLLSSICFSPKPAGRSWIRSSMSAWPPTSNNSTRTRRSTPCPSKAVDASPNPISTD